MNYRLIQSVDGRLMRSDFTDENLLPAMEARGFKFHKLNARPGQRAELQGQPCFLGVLGPMWDGDAVRYEDKKAYAQLST